jgi:diaphanous 1
LAADVLAAICVLSSSEGHKLVISAFSEFKITYSEDVRFEYLVKSISVSDEQDTSHQEEEDDASLWEYRAAGMALISALANSPEDLEERMLLRDELARRGLNEAMTVRSTSLSRLSIQLTCTLMQTLRYMNPPDALATQIAVYMEEKQEDQEEHRDRHLDSKSAAK